MKKFNFYARLFVAITGPIIGFSFLIAIIGVRESEQVKEKNSLLSEKRIILLNISPDHQHLLFTLFQREGHQVTIPTFIQHNFQKKTLPAISLQSKENIYLPFWNADSQSITFISQGEKFLSLWTSPASEFKPQKLVEIEENIVAYKWSPNQEYIAIVVNKSGISIPFKFVQGQDESEAQEIIVLEKNRNHQGFVKTSLTPEGISLLKKDKTYDQSFTWTPDSQHVLVISSPSLAGLYYAPLAELSLIDIRTKNKKILLKGKGRILSPCVSPDGQYVAFITNLLEENEKRPIRTYGMDTTRICLIDLKTFQKRCLANTPNENPTLIGWGEKGQSLFAVDQEGFANHIYKLNLDGKFVIRFTEGEKGLSEVHLSPSGDALIYSAEDLRTPAEGFITSTKRFEPKKIISNPLPYRDLLMEKVQWTSQDHKLELEGLLIYPKSYKQGNSFPLFTILSDYLYPFLPLQYIGTLLPYPISYPDLLERGYGIFIPQRRGSNGYGVSSREAIYKNLGGEDLNDVLGGIDKLIQEKKANPDHLVLWGWGYGGYLAAWALTQTNRFKAGIVGAGMADMISQSGTTFGPPLLEEIMGGPYWNHWKRWDEKSPISHVKKIKTPVLIQHGHQDSTFQKDQSQSLYFPLKTINHAVELFIYPEQKHYFEWLEIILTGIQDLNEWLDKTTFSPPSHRQEKP